VLQRNPFPYPIDLPTLQPPVRLLGGETIDYSEPLAGLEEVNDDPPTDKTDKPGKVVGRSSKPVEGETRQ